MTDLKKLCLQLDDLVVEYFHTLDERIKKQSELDTLMKDGFINMAKARYNMGHQAVGQLQYHEEDLVKASSHLVVTESDYGHKFEIEETKDAGVNKEEKENEDSGLRRRNVNETGSNLTEDIQTNAKTAKGGDKETDQKKKTTKDPLNWFGVLLPQTLRQSQSRFKASIPLCCELATLQSKLLALKTKYKQLHHEKAEILGDGSECDQERPASLSFSSVSSISSVEDLTEEIASGKLNHAEE